jgi:DNA-binding IclR family transcriptional regulator
MVERMTLILDAFTGRTTRLSLEDVARRTRLPRSTAHRILEQLVKLRWLEHTQSGYGLGRRALGLGGGDGAHSEIRAVAAARLHELQIRTGLVVHLAVLDEGQVHYLDKAGGRFAASVPSWVGGRAPAHATALGKAMLAWLEPEEAEARIGEAMGRLTQRTIADLPTLHQELNRIRQRRGLTFEHGEYYPGIACVAAAVRGPDGPVAAISLAGEARTPLERVAPLVVDAARQVSQDLFPCADGTDNAERAVRPKAAAAAPARTWSAQTMDRLLATGHDGDWL